MYRLFFCILIFLASEANAQNWNTTVSASPVLSFRRFNHLYTSNQSELGYSLGIREEYNINSVVSVGTELEYVRSGFSYYSQYDAAGDDVGVRSAFKHDVSENRLYLPLFAKVNFPRTERFSIYALAGIGANYMLRANRTVTQVTDLETGQHAEVAERIPYEGGNLFSKRSPIVNNLTFGLGAEWKVGKSSLLFELKSRDDIQARVYQNVQSPDQSDALTIRTSMLSFALGVKF